jgi:hypothetical protein
MHGSCATASNSNSAYRPDARPLLLPGNGTASAAQLSTLHFDAVLVEPVLVDALL